MATADFVREHLQALEIGSKVTGWFRKEFEPNLLDVTPENVLDTLHNAGITPVLIGTHGINVYRDQARATQDVDLLVAMKEVRKTTKALSRRFPFLMLKEDARLARLLDPVRRKPVIDVHKPTSSSRRNIFRNVVSIEGKYRIPNLEMALVSKFVAFSSRRTRRAKRYLHLGDFVNIAETNRKAINLARLRHLASDARPGGGKTILKLIEDIDAGRDIHV